MKYRDLQLCYARAPWAYFSHKPPTEMWADDWNDRPYEHNAGTPHDAFKIAFDAEYDEPCTDHCNSPWSVEAINRGEIAWLRQSRYSSEKKTPIFAGCTLAQFVDLVSSEGGTVYLPGGFAMHAEAPEAQ